MTLRISSSSFFLTVLMLSAPGFAQAPSSVPSLPPVPGAEVPVEETPATPTKMVSAPAVPTPPAVPVPPVTAPIAVVAAKPAPVVSATTVATSAPTVTVAPAVPAPPALPAAPVASAPAPKGDAAFDALFASPGVATTSAVPTPPVPVVEKPPAPKKKTKPKKKRMPAPENPDAVAKTLPVEDYNIARDAQNRHLPAVRYTQEYETWLFRAAARGDTNGLKALLDLGLPVSATTAEGESLLMVAVRHGAGASVDYLLGRGANPNDAFGGYSALHYAAYLGDVDMAYALVRAGADRNATDENGVTPRDLARQTGKSPRLLEVLE